MRAGFTPNSWDFLTRNTYWMIRMATRKKTGEGLIMPLKISMNNGNCGGWLAAEEQPGFAMEGSSAQIHPPFVS
jgi:hypothetical protein